MDDCGFFQSWFAVLCAVLGTMIWRAAGVMLASRIPAEGPIMGWVNTMAYALVAAVLLLIFVHPIGVLATTSLDQRIRWASCGACDDVFQQTVDPYPVLRCKCVCASY